MNTHEVLHPNRLTQGERLRVATLGDALETLPVVSASDPVDTPVVVIDPEPSGVEALIANAREAANVIPVDFAQRTGSQTLREVA